MKKKLLITLFIVVIIILALYFIINNKSSISNNGTSNSTKSTNTQTSSSNFRIKSAFADIDFDITLQDKDPVDDDKTSDYIFLTFSDNVKDNKKDNNSNPFNPKNYKLDGSSLSNCSILQDKVANKIIIKLPDGNLKGVNTPHSLEISKDLINEKGKKVSGDLNIKLPFSDSDDSSNSKNDITNNTSAKNNNINNDKSTNNSTTDNTSNSSDSSPSDTTTPNYTVELGKGVPFVTIIVVKLDTPNPENYKVTVDGTELKLKKDAEGQTIFANGVKKEYDLAEVKKLIKIEKIK